LEKSRGSQIIEAMIPRIVLLLFPTLLLSGCLDFGTNIETTSPSAADVERCRAEMYIDPEAGIQPVGFRLISSLDDAIWFKFVAETADISTVFRDEIVETSRFGQTVMSDDPSSPAWWDVSEQSLVGGQVDLPNARFMQVGHVDNGDGTLTVYILWQET